MLIVIACDLASSSTILNNDMWRNVFEIMHYNSGHFLFVSPLQTENNVSN